MKPLRKLKAIPPGWTRATLITPTGTIGLRQQMAEFTGALDFMLFWREQVAELIDNQDMNADAAVSAWLHAVAAFADWRAR
jgi:hypothetical protein